MTSKQKILNSITQARDLHGLVTLPTTENCDYYFQPESNLQNIFKAEFELVSGEFYSTKTLTETQQTLADIITKKGIHSISVFDKNIKDKIPNYISINFERPIGQANAAINTCEFLIARTGSVFISSKQISGRRINVIPPVLIILAHHNQIVYNIDDAIIAMQTKYSYSFPSLCSIITGPSRTADIEKTLILGAHGPKEIVVIVQID